MLSGKKREREEDGKDIPGSPTRRSVREASPSGSAPGFTQVAVAAEVPSACPSADWFEDLNTASEERAAHAWDAVVEGTEVLARAVNLEEYLASARRLTHDQCYDLLNEAVDRIDEVRRLLRRDNVPRVNVSPFQVACQLRDIREKVMRVVCALHK